MARTQHEQAEILSHMGIVYLDDGQGGSHKAIRFTAVNVQIVNGSGSTDGLPNGSGNLIVGYNETGNLSGDNRSGSHNIVGGKANSYSSYGDRDPGGALSTWPPSVGGGQNGLRLLPHGALSLQSVAP